jgi:hypothetical protein
LPATGSSSSLAECASWAGQPAALSNASTLVAKLKEIKAGKIDIDAAVKGAAA